MVHVCVCRYFRVSRGPTATISFDRVDLVKPVFHGDLVRTEGQVISMSNSSMAIQVPIFFINASKVLCARPKILHSVSHVRCGFFPPG